MKASLATASLVLAAAVAWPSPTSTWASQAAGSVRVTVARANVRDAPNTTGSVLTQVTGGTTLPLVEVMGDWFKVRVPISGFQVDAYISKTVSTLVEGTGGASSTAPAPGPTDGAEIMNGMSVAIQAGEGASWLKPVATTLVTVAGRPASLAAVAGLVQPTPPAATGGAPVTFGWSVAQDPAPRELTDRRPVFVVQFDAVPRVDASKLTVAIVTLVVTPGGTALVSAVPGRADQAMWGDLDWDVMRSLLQRTERTTVQAIGPGAARVQPTDPLAPGRYAVVVRPAGSDRLAGSDVLRDRAMGLVFGVAWPFVIR